MESAGPSPAALGAAGSVCLSVLQLHLIPFPAAEVTPLFLLQLV